jgi:CheY-like chemotaxis protein
MINDVLDLSQTEAGRLSLRKEWVDLPHDIRAAIEVVQPLIQKKKLGLHVQVSDTLPDVYCDRTRIRQVILNLVSNAARYTDHGTICVEATSADRCVIVSVVDTGPGIPAHEIDKIFEPFYQGANGAWRDRSGSGLGLAISRQFIELHEGQIWAESSIGHGSKFSFRLPVSPLAPVTASSGRWINEEWKWMERTSRPAVPQLPFRQRIILYDETGELSALFAQSCRDIEFVDTHSMAETIATLENCPAHAVIVNAALPANLLPLLENARLAIPDTPILGYSVPHRIDHAIESGALNYLIKPVTRADIKEMADSFGKPLQRVLIVDDDADFGRLLTRMWQTLDPSVQLVIASNGETALALLHDSPPDLMLLDIAMPNQDGWQVLTAKNQDPLMREVPVTIVSAQDPMDYPQSSGILVAAFGNGIPVGKLPICSLQLADLLLTPVQELDPAHG